MQLPAIEERHSITQEEFHDNYLSNPRPLVMRGFVSDWPATARWDPNYLRTAADGYEIGMLSKSDYASQGSLRHFEKRVSVAFAEAVSIAQMKDAPELSYARQSSIWTEIPALRADVGEIGLGLNVIKDEGFFWLGPSGTVAQLHWDPGHNLVAQLRGQKQWILIPPEDSTHTYPNKFHLCDALRACDAEATWQRIHSAGATGDIETTLRDALTEQERDMLFHYLAAVNNCEVDAEAPDALSCPEFCSTRRFEVTVRTGDLLFIPLAWRHQVRSLTPSISMNWFFHCDRKIPESLINRTLLEHLVV